ncbi:hypothetical protein HY485_05465, partial [Candidatus Woesearchaeota archaeon]|nr:hypothetical protein [Candidatus Woesearchaeota archaeon]
MKTVAQLTDAELTDIVRKEFPDIGHEGAFSWIREQHSHAISSVEFSKMLNCIRTKGYIQDAITLLDDFKKGRNSVHYKLHYPERKADAELEVRETVAMGQSIRYLATIYT